MSNLRGLCCLILITGCAHTVSAGSNSNLSAVRGIAEVTSSLRSEIAVLGRRPVEEFTLAERMAHHSVPGVSIAVVEGGEIAWARGFGVKSAGSTDSVTAATLFQAASVSKPIAATGMLKMVEAGLLDLDEPVNGYLRSWRIPANEFTGEVPVTLRHIASHGAGLTVHGYSGYEAGKPTPSVPEILDGSGSTNSPPVRVDFVPGSGYRYSGGGFTVLQLAMRDVADESFPSVMSRLVLDPLGMTNSTFDQPLPGRLAPQAAFGHNRAGELMPGRWNVFPTMAAAGLWTTPTDLLKWARAVAEAAEGRTDAFLPESLAKEMLTVQHGRTGLGPSLGGTGRGFHFGHTGANLGFISQLIYFPATGQGAAVVVNSDGGMSLIREILLAIGKTYGWPEYAEIDPVALTGGERERYVGEYGVGAPVPLMLLLSEEDQRLYVEGPGLMGKQEVVLTAPDRGVALQSGTELSFRGVESGSVSGVRLIGYSLERTAFPRSTWRAYAGEYQMGGGYSVDVKVDGPAPTLQFVGRPAEYPMIPESEDVFSVSIWMKVAFDRDDSGEVTAIRIIPLQGGREDMGVKVK